MQLISALITILLTLSVTLAEAENNIGNDNSHMGRPFNPYADFSNSTAMTNVTALNGTVIVHDEKEIRQTPSGFSLFESMEYRSFRNKSLENDSLWEGNHKEIGAIGITAARHALILKAKANQLKTLLSNCFIDGELNHEKYHFARELYEQLTEELQDSVLSETERIDLDETMLHIHISILFSDMHANRVDKPHHGQHRSCIEASSRRK